MIKVNQSAPLSQILIYMRLINKDMIFFIQRWSKYNVSNHYRLIKRTLFLLFSTLKQFVNLIWLKINHIDYFSCIFKIINGIYFHLIFFFFIKISIDELIFKSWDFRSFNVSISLDLVAHFSLSWRWSISVLGSWSSFLFLLGSIWTTSLSILTLVSCSVFGWRLLSFFGVWLHFFICLNKHFK